MRLREKQLLRQRGRVLFVTAVAAERDAIARGCGSDPRFTVVDGGVGSARAAAATAAALARADEPFLGAISAGIGGGFDPAGTVVIGRTSVAADLGAETADGFIDLDELGFGSSTVECDPDLLELLRLALPDAAVGPILSVSTVTGTAERARQLRDRHPDALAEGMEGFGVAVAAAQAETAFGEIRTISNPVGPRDRAAWRIPEALAALERAAAALAAHLSRNG